MQPEQIGSRLLQSEAQDRAFVDAIKIGSGYTGQAAHSTQDDHPFQAKATQEVDLAFEVAGTLAKRPANIGDTVEAGALTAQLDQRRFLAELKAAEAQLAKDNFERAEELIKQDFISKTQYDELEAKMVVAESNLDLAQKAQPFQGANNLKYI